MGRTRDIIQEIIDMRQRRHSDFAMQELGTRLLFLELSFNKLNKDNCEIIRYYPVALVACIEGYFRMVIKELIDIGEPYLSNAEKPISSVKLDFSVLKAVHGKSITVGELVAHAVKLSRLEQINSVLTDILGKEFLNAIRTTVDRWEHEVKENPAIPILSEPDKIYSEVSRTFELRHIICHEITSTYEISYDEVSRCFESCVVFLKATKEFISETINPSAPLTQTDMNIVAGESVDRKKEELFDAIKALKNRLDKDEIVLFDDSQEKWQLYSKAWAYFNAGNRDKGGTIWPMVYANALEEIFQNRIEEIKSYKRLGE